MTCNKYSRNLLWHTCVYGEKLMAMLQAKINPFMHNHFALIICMCVCIHNLIRWAGQWNVITLAGN